MNTSIRYCMALLACLLATGCSRLAGEDDTQAEVAHVVVAEQAQGVTPFIVNLALKLDDFAHLDTVSYTIAPRPGTFSKPVAVTYTRAWLERKGAWNAADKRLALAVFGLYADYRNSVTLTARFRDQSTTSSA
jgi:arylsulfate sulfotransferase